MTGTSKIVLAIGVSDNADILRETIEWYFHLGVEFVMAYDCASTDGSQDILDDYARRKLLHWLPLPDNNTTRFNIYTNLGYRARDFGADWIICCDADEFAMSSQASLHDMLDHASKNDITVINMPRFAMTGAPLPPKASAPEMLTLRIDCGAPVSREQILALAPPVPCAFIHQPPKTIARASALMNYGGGGHTAMRSYGLAAKLPGLSCLHYRFRGYQNFAAKVRSIATWLEDNAGLDRSLAWQWRRWVKMDREGRLREEYEAQFVSPSRAAELIRDGTCSLDTTVSDWIKSRKVR